MNNSNSKSNTLNVSEKLPISQTAQVILPEVPEEIIYPNELNTFLREQLRYYVHQNGMLQKNLSELEQRYSECKGSVSKLETKLTEYENVSDKSKINTASQVAGSKIIELSKKLREKTSEMESLKTKYSRLEKHALELKSQVENDSHELVKDCQDTPPNSLSDEEIKRYSGKVASLSSKVGELKNINLQLKNELKLANKLLQQEVGDSFENLQATHNSNSTGWRGRAQIICDLQQKNAELKEKLKSAQEKNKQNNFANVTPDSTSIENSSSLSKNDPQIIALTKENNELKVKLEELKKKHDVAKARIKSLDMEYSLTKSKLSMMKDQATRDQEIISTLSKQINFSKESKNDVLMQKEHAITKLQTEKKNLLHEIDEYKTLIKDLREEISTIKKDKTDNNNNDEKEVIKKIENKISETDSNKHEKIVELIANINKRLKIEREAHSKTQAALRIEKQKITKAEALIARMELDTANSTKSGYSSTSSLKPLDLSLKDQLELAEENLKAVKTRLEIEQMERKNDLQTFAQILKTIENGESKSTS